MSEEKKPETRAEETAPPKATQEVKAAPPAAKVAPAVTAAPAVSTAVAPAAKTGASVATMAPPVTEEETATTLESVTELTREDQAKALMYKYMIQNAALGLLPIPIIDVITIGGTQLAMLNAISKVYDIDYSQHMAKPIIASLVGALGYDFAVRGIAGALVKTIPVFGLLVGVASMPIMGAASTYAVGKIFIQHFESGGTFINFDIEEAKKYFSQYYKEGIHVAIGMKDKVLKPKISSAAGADN